MDQTFRKMFGAIIAGISFLALLILSRGTFENIDANEIMVVQSPISGNLTWHTTAGVKWQGFGKVTVYPKRAIYRFAGRIRFNDGAHATMYGSIQYEMPLTVSDLTNIQTKFGNNEAVKNQLIETITNKAIYMTGPLMSSKESYAEKRNDLILYVEDQVAGGVYKTIQTESKEPDPMTGVEKTVTKVTLLREKNGEPSRQEESVLAPFGIRPFNFAIDSLPYDSTVEAQINQQQALTMGIQTAVAEAKKAEQKAITAEKEGQAEAAKSKWVQEVIKAQQVVEAQQRLEVATLAAKAAEQTKREQILLGEGEGERKKLVMQANGALDQKLDTYLKVSALYAAAIKDYQGAWVPGIVIGSDGKSMAGSGANELINLLMIKTAHDLGIDMGVSGTEKTKQNPR